MKEILHRLTQIERLLADLQENQPKEFLTIDEAAKLLKVTRPTLWSWDRKGILPVRHIGNVARYRRADIDRILNNGCTK